ncbi:MAG TPA: hypothetical protein VNO33_08015, partial [Kofleriaceae bacterium]|nr:hypothetical protein [Kofleriaceae bacterium]
MGRLTTDEPSGSPRPTERFERLEPGGGIPGLEDEAPARARRQSAAPARHDATLLMTPITMEQAKSARATGRTPRSYALPPGVVAPGPIERQSPTARKQAEAREREAREREARDRIETPPARPVLTADGSNGQPPRPPPRTDTLTGVTGVKVEPAQPAAQAVAPQASGPSRSTPVQPAPQAAPVQAAPSVQSAPQAAPVQAAPQAAPPSASEAPTAPMPALAPQPAAPQVPAPPILPSSPPTGGRQRAANPPRTPAQRKHHESHAPASGHPTEKRPAARR